MGNLASRIERTGVIGQIQLAASMARLMSPAHRVIPASRCRSKGKAYLTTYLPDLATA